MTTKFIVGASVLLGAGLALCGCQNSSPRSGQTTGFAQKQGSTNPPVVSPNNQSQPALMGANNQTMQPNGNITPTYSNTSPGSFSGAHSSLSGAPSTSPSNLGSQSRTTQPFIPTSGAAPGFGAPNTSSPGFGPGPSGQGFNNPPPPAPPNYGTGPAIP